VKRPRYRDIQEIEIPIVADSLRRVLAVVILAIGITPAASAQDTTPPTLIDLVIETPSIDTTSSGDEFLATLRIQDDLSGARSSVQIVFYPPPGSAVPTQYGTCSRVSGTVLDGTYQCRQAFPQFSFAGVWSLGVESVIDLAGNRADWSTVQLAAAGFPNTFELVTANIDVSPVVLDFGAVDLGLSN
jgi:hypothetical protein